MIHDSYEAMRVLKPMYDAMGVEQAYKGVAHVVLADREEFHVYDIRKDAISTSVVYAAPRSSEFAIDKSGTVIKDNFGHYIKQGATCKWEAPAKELWCDCGGHKVKDGGHSWWCKSRKTAG